jgi:hypothetical protein
MNAEIHDKYKIQRRSVELQDVMVFSVSYLGGTGFNTYGDQLS